jgi:hypothetical protein
MEENLVPEERDLANALRVIVKKHGKFNADNTGVWAGYDSAEKNAENASIGVKCGNCVFWQAPNGCEIIASETEEGGLCRFAVLPDGSVTPKAVPIPEEDLEFSANGPCWDGYKQVGMKMKDGKMVPNCVPDNEASVTATAGSKPAPKKDQIKGSDKNKEGSASDGKGITFTAEITKALEKKVADHNEKAKNGRKVTLRMLKAVYRRGAGAFSTSHRADQNRNSWAMARVNAFLKLVKSGKPSNSKYVQDNDLLPKMHPRSTEASTDKPLLASLVAALNDNSCPPATRDIVLNVKNRQNAIDNVGYGPLNPAEPNDEFWQEKADRWKTTPVEAKKSICGNCVFFVRTPSMLDCISSGIEEGGSGEQNAWDAIDQAELGFCEALDFKCAASRTCNAWAAGGPITEED